MFLLIELTLILSLFTSAGATSKTTSPTSDKYKASSSDGHLEFLAIGRPAMIRIKGESNGPEGEVTIREKNITGEFRLALANLDTGIDMRDRHMKEKYLEIDKNPQATLTIQTLAFDDSNKVDVPFAGILQLHGANKPVTGVVNYKHEGLQKRAHAEFKIRLSDYQIKIPSYAGIIVADEVEIKLDLNLKPE